MSFGRERKSRNNALWLMVIGIIVIKFATVWAISLLGTDHPGAYPLVMAGMGLAVGTAGFLQFVCYDRRTRFIRPVRAPDFDSYLDGYTLPHRN